MASALFGSSLACGAVGDVQGEALRVRVYSLWPGEAWHPHCKLAFAVSAPFIPLHSPNRLQSQHRYCQCLKRRCDLVKGQAYQELSAHVGLCSVHKRERVCRALDVHVKVTCGILFCVPCRQGWRALLS